MQRQLIIIIFIFLSINVTCQTSENANLQEVIRQRNELENFVNQYPDSAFSKAR